MVLPQMLFPWMIVGKFVLILSNGTLWMTPESPALGKKCETSGVEVPYPPPKFTLPDTHMFASKNRSLECNGFPFGMAYFQGLC